MRDRNTADPFKPFFSIRYCRILLFDLLDRRQTGVSFLAITQWIKFSSQLFKDEPGKKESQRQRDKQLLVRSYMNKQGTGKIGKRLKQLSSRWKVLVYRKCKGFAKNRQKWNDKIDQIVARKINQEEGTEKAKKCYWCMTLMFFG